MNIVTESKKHEKITSVNDCLKPDGITDNLWTWAERLEKLGKILLWIIIISGLVIALSTSIVTTEVEKGYYYTYTDTETTFSFGVFLTAIIQTALYAFIEYCAYHVLALLIGALANITQNTKTTARLTEYIARKTFNEEYANTETVSESQEQMTEPEKTTELNPDGKVCPKCGIVQCAKNRECWSCGHQFDN